MPNKYYVILYNADDNAITFPKKAAQNPFNASKFRDQFAGGYPAIFGGTDSGGADETLIKEVGEESRGTLQAETPFELFFQGEGSNSNLYFYSATKWRKTGRSWGKPQNRDEAEMSKPATIRIEEFSSEDSNEEILEKLISLSGSPGGSDRQLREFQNSETAKAFILFIRKHPR